MEKDWPKRPSDHQLQGAWKKTDRAITPAVEAVHVPEHLVLLGPHNSSSCATFTLNSYWGRAVTGKKSLASMHKGLLRSCPTLCHSVDCGLPGFSVREGYSPGKNAGAYWPIPVAIPFYSSIFPPALTTNSPEYLLQPKHLYHLHT